MNEKYRATISPALVSALNQLRKLVETGVEFPDAIWKVTQRTGFSSEELERAYDHDHQTS